MAEEEAKLAEEGQDESLDTQEEENPEEESTEEKPEAEESEEEVQEFDEEEDYNESLGIGRLSGEEVAAEVKKLREENATLKQYKAETGFESPKPPPQAQQTDEHKFFKETGLATKHIGTIQFGTDDAGQKAKKSYEVMAQLVDSAVDPLIKQTEQGMQTFRWYFAKVAEHLIGQSYKGFGRKDLVPLNDIREQMLNDFDFDSEKYAKKYLFERKPDLLAELVRKAEQKGEQRGQKKRLKKYSSTRRTKGSPKAGVDWKPYFDSVGDPNDKFRSLSTDERLKVAEAYKVAAERDIKER